MRTATSQREPRLQHENNDFSMELTHWAYGMGTTNWDHQTHKYIYVRLIFGRFRITTE